MPSQYFLPYYLFHGALPGQAWGCDFTVWKKGLATWKHVTSPSHKRTKKISAPCTFKFVWFLEKKNAFLSSMALKVLCVSLLWYDYSLFLLKSWKTSVTYFEQDGKKRGAGGTFHRIIERAQKSIQPSPIGRTGPPYIWNTYFLYAPNKCIWCMWEVSERGKVDGREIQCSLLALLGWLWAERFSQWGLFHFWVVHTLKYTYQKHHKFLVANLIAKKSPLNWSFSPLTPETVKSLAAAGMWWRIPSTLVPWVITDITHTQLWLFPKRH